MFKADISSTTLIASITSLVVFPFDGLVRKIVSSSFKRCGQSLRKASVKVLVYNLRSNTLVSKKS